MEGRLKWLDATITRVKELIGAGKYKDAVTLTEDLRVRCAADADWRVQGRLAVALSEEADARLRLGEPAEMLACFDEVVALVSRSEELTRRGTAVPALRLKAHALANLGKSEEALVVLDSEMGALRRATASKVVTRSREAAVAAVFKLDLLWELGRDEELGTVVEQLAALLSEIPEPWRATGPRSRNRPRPESLAECVACIVNDGSYWTIFEGRNQRFATEDLAERAIRLYLVSEPLAISTDGGRPTAADVAAALVRDVADGYALLAGDWTPAERAQLPLPTEAEDGRLELIREFGVDEWAANHGHPLRTASRTPTPRHTREASAPGEGFDVEEFDRRLGRTTMRLACVYELARVLADTTGGRQALRHKVFRGLAIHFLRSARTTLRALAIADEGDERAAILVAHRFIAQGLFTASHSRLGASADLFPPPESLQALLRESGAYEWLANRGIAL